jgi:hypothetical protein
MESVVMLVAMIDVIAGSLLLPAVAWTAVLLVAGMLLGLVGGRRAAGRAVERGMTVHAALECIVMAGMIALMMGGGAADVSAGAAAAGHHGGSSTAVTLVVAACALVYAAASFAAAAARARGRERGRWQQRAQHVGMGAATLVMGAATLL